MSWQACPRCRGIIIIQPELPDDDTEGDYTGAFNVHAQCVNPLCRWSNRL